MRRSFKFLLRPTGKQAAALTRCLEDHREPCSADLEHRRTAYRRAGATVRYGDQSGESKHIRAGDPDGRGRWSFSATYVRLQGVGHVRVRRHRRVPGTVKTISVKRECARWFVVVSCDDVPAETLPATGEVAGIASLVTTSDGEHLANPRHLAAAADRLAAAQRDLARKKRGGKRRRKAVARVAASHAKVRRQRLDGVHEAATLDAGWGVFLRILSHKAESAGRELIAVSPADTSRTCAECGHCAKENRAPQAGFRCTACGHAAHADVDAAINIVRAGLALRDAAEAA